MEKSVRPFSMRASEEDWAMVDYLKERLGLGAAGVVRLALRKLYHSEKKAEK